MNFYRSYALQLNERGLILPVSAPRISRMVSIAGAYNSMVTLIMRKDTTTGLDTIPTVTDSAFAQGLIPAKQVGISFAPSAELSAANGLLTFGGIDESRFIGPLTTVYVFLHYSLILIAMLTCGWQANHIHISLERVRRH